MTAQETYTAFLDAQKVIGYKLGDLEGTPEADMLKYTELKLAVQQEQAKIDAFNKSKEEARAIITARHDEELIAFGQEWQTKEDNNYTI